MPIIQDARSATAALIAASGEDEVRCHLEECKPSKVVLNTVSVRAGMLCSQKFVHLDNCIFRRCSFRSSSASDSKDFMALEYELLQQVRKLGA